jgi:SAM-dependent methyltransferase
MVFAVIQRRPAVTPPSQTLAVDASELRARARQEADELGPEPPGRRRSLCAHQGVAEGIIAIGDGRLSVVGQGKAMAVYREHVLPRVINVMCGLKVAQPLRRRVCEALTGDVVEIGFGSGLNIPFYPDTVTRVVAVEPADLAWKLAAKRLQEATVPVARSGLDGQALPFPDNSFDAALSTWTMCTIPDVDAALRELRRVLKPGGTLHFLEHGLAPDDSVRHWQHRLEPVQKRVFGGCHLTRPVVEQLTGAGFVVTDVDVFYEKGAPKPMGADSLGTALSP